MILEIILFIVGLAMILFGANWLTDGGSAIAKKFGISELVIGLTIVAFGTSAPELVISVVSSVKGNAGIAIGNVVGSNIFNVLMIIGIVSMVRPIKIEKSILNNEIPLVIIASIALLACGMSTILDNAAENAVTRVSGIFLLLFFCIFMRYTFSIAKKSEDAATLTPASLSSENKQISETEDKQISATAASEKGVNIWKSILLIIAGLICLVWGGDIFVDNASAFAIRLGVSQGVVGLTIVAMGTSLPELATSIVAAVKGRQGLAVGNVIGSCLFNIFFVLGVSSVVHELPFGTIGLVDLLVMTGSALLFWIFGWWIKKREITRGEGAVMVLCYIGYTVWLILNA